MLSENIRISATDEKYSRAELKDLEYIYFDEMIDVIRSFPNLLPQFRDRDILIYPEVLQTRHRKKFLIALDVGKEIIHPIIVEYFYINPLRIPQPDKKEKIYYVIHPDIIAEFMYKYVVREIERRIPCRTKSKWAMSFEMWLMNIYKEKDRESLCRDLVIDEVTLMFQVIDHMIIEIMSIISDKTDFIVYATQILKTSLTEKNIYLAITYTYKPPDMRKIDQAMYLKRLIETK